jgi:hypothetical protein
MHNPPIRQSGVLFGNILMICVILAAPGCESGEKAGTDTDSPAITEPQPKAPISAATTENPECLVCHMDFEHELIAARHAKEGLGCGFCHGPSVAHGGDEMNITPPDRLFGRAEITEFCQDCHPTHKQSKRYDAFVRKWLDKRRPNGRMVLDDSVCTDCHGKHAILRPDQQL